MIIGTKRSILAASCAVLAVIFLGGCSTTPVSLTYNASAIQAEPARTPNSVAVISVIDHRKHEANWLGAIRGGFGNALKTLRTTEPVNEVVKKVFSGGLKARGLLASGKGRYGLKIELNQFDCNQYARLEAHIRFKVSVVETESGNSIHEKEVKVDKVEGSKVTFKAGVFASVWRLRDLANKALQEAVDKTLDDPALAAKL